MAKYYIYWNFHKKMYSVRYKGRVIGHTKSLVAFDVKLQVSQKGREKVLREKRKNVHAYVVAKDILSDMSVRGEPTEVSYNPYKNDSFVDTNGKSVDSARVAELIVVGDKPKIKIFVDLSNYGGIILK